MGVVLCFAEIMNMINLLRNVSVKMNIFQVGSKSEANGIAKSGAKMVMAVSCAKVDILLHVMHPLF